MSKPGQSVQMFLLGTWEGEILRSSVAERLEGTN